MKVLQINSVYGYASTGRTVMELHRELQKMSDIDSYVACFRTNQINDDVLTFSSPYDYYFHTLMERLTGLQGWFSVGETKKLIARIDSLNPDIIHLHNIHDRYVNVPMLFRYMVQKQIPAVITLDDCFFFTGRCFHFTKVGCDGYISGCDHCPIRSPDYFGAKTWFFSWARLLSETKANLFKKMNKLAVVGVSDWITNAARKSYILKSTSLFKRIYNWIDLDVFAPLDASPLREKLGLKGKFVILGVASDWKLKGKKGLKFFVEMSHSLAPDERIVLIGAKRNNIEFPSNIIFVGSTHNAEELAQYYNLADVFVTMSEEESFGKVSAEALACGTPIVCFNSTANPELVGENCGYVVSKANVNAVIDRVHKIRLDTKAAYSNDCVTFARRNFDKVRLIQEHIALYRELYVESKSNSK